MAPPGVVQCSTLTVVHGGPASERPETCKDGSTEVGDNFLLGHREGFEEEVMFGFGL